MVAAFPPGTVASFAIWQLAGDVRRGKMSRWSDPIVSASADKIAQEFQCLSQEVIDCIAAVVAAAMQPSKSGSAEEDIQVALTCERVGMLATSEVFKTTSHVNGKENSQKDCEELMRQALGDLAVAAEQACSNSINDQLRALPRWCSSCSNTETAGATPQQHDVALLTSRSTTGVDVETAVVAYCSALRECLATAAPGVVRVPQRAVVGLLPPHFQETATDIHLQLVNLRQVLAPTTNTGINCELVDEDRLVAAADVGTELLELLDRLAAQAAAASGSSASLSLSEQLRGNSILSMYATAITDASDAVEGCLNRHVPGAVCRRRRLGCAAAQCEPEEQHGEVVLSEQAGGSTSSNVSVPAAYDQKEVDAPQHLHFVQQNGLVSTPRHGAPVGPSTPGSSPQRIRTRQMSNPLLLGSSSLQRECFKSLGSSATSRPTTPNRIHTSSDLARRLQLADHIKAVAKEASRLADGVLAAKEAAKGSDDVRVNVTTQQELPKNADCHDAPLRVAPGESMPAKRPSTPAGKGISRTGTPTSNCARRSRVAGVDRGTSLTSGSSAQVLDSQRLHPTIRDSRTSAPPRTSQRESSKGSSGATAAKFKPVLSRLKSQKRMADADAFISALDRSAKPRKDESMTMTSQGSQLQRDPGTDFAARIGVTEPSGSMEPEANHCSLWANSQRLKVNALNAKCPAEQTESKDALTAADRTGSYTP